MSTEAQKIRDAAFKRCGVDVGILAAGRSASNIRARRRVVAEMRACRTRSTQQLTIAEVAEVLGLHWSTARNYAAAVKARAWTLR